MVTNVMLLSHVDLGSFSQLAAAAHTILVWILYSCLNTLTLSDPDLSRQWFGLLSLDCVNS